MALELEGLAVEGSAGAACGLCLQELGVPGHLAVPLGVVAAVLVRWALEVARPAVVAWWAHRRASRDLDEVLEDTTGPVSRGPPPVRR